MILLVFESAERSRISLGPDRRARNPGPSARAPLAGRPVRVRSVPEEGLRMGLQFTLAVVLMIAIAALMVALLFMAAMRTARKRRRPPRLRLRLRQQIIRDPPLQPLGGRRDASPMLKRLFKSLSMKAKRKRSPIYVLPAELAKDSRPTSSES